MTKAELIKAIKTAINIYSYVDAKNALGVSGTGWNTKVENGETKTSGLENICGGIANVSDTKAQILVEPAINVEISTTYNIRLVLSCLAFDKVTGVPSTDKCLLELNTDYVLSNNKIKFLASQVGNKVQLMYIAKYEE